MKIRNGLYKYIAVVFIMVLVMSTCFNTTVKVSAATVTKEVSDLAGLKSALEDDTVTTIILTSSINLSNGTELDGKGKTLQVRTPHLSAAGYISQSPTKQALFIISNGGTVKLSNMTLLGGSAPGSGIDAGGVNVTNGTCYLENINMCRSERALNVKGSNAKAVMKNCNIVRNLGWSGGGVGAYDGGVIVMDECSLTENRTYSAGGGAMESNGGYFYINNSTIANNCSAQTGGAINSYTETSHLYVMNSNIIGNVSRVDGVNNSGAGILVGGEAYAVNCIITNNYCADDKSATLGVPIVGCRNNAKIKLINCIFDRTPGIESSSRTGISIQYEGIETPTTGGKEFVSYRTDGLLWKESGYTYGYKHPALTGKNGNSLALYAPANTVNGGVVTYFDYSNLNDIKMSYGPSNTSLGGKNISDKLVTEYYENGTRNTSGNIQIGASASTQKTYYTVKLEANPTGGTVSGITSFGDGYSEGSEITVKAIPDSGYAFEGWYKGSEKVSSNSIYVFTVDSNLTITAKFVAGRSVAFDANGGKNAPADQNLTGPYKASKPETEPVRKGYKFLGWSTNEAATEADFDFETEITQNTILYAVWQESGSTGSLVPYTPEEPSLIDYNEGYLRFDAGQEHVIAYAKAMTGEDFNEFGDENKGIYIDLTDETLVSSFAFKYYSTDNGRKWIKATKIEQKQLAKFFSKNVNIRLADKLDEKEKHPAEDAIVYGFDTIRKRPSTPTVKVDFFMARDEFGTTNGQWMLVSRMYSYLDNLRSYEIKINDDTGADFAMDMTGVAEGTKGKLFTDYKAFTGTFGKNAWGRWPSEGGVWVPGLSNEGRSRKAKIEVRIAPTQDEDGFTAASKSKKLTVSSVGKVPTVKVNYQKEEIRFKKGMTAYFGTADSIKKNIQGAPEFYCFPYEEEDLTYEDYAGTAILTSWNVGVKKPISIAPYLTGERNTIILWQNATQKKPASARQTIKLEARYVITKDNIMPVEVKGGKAKMPNGFVIISENGNQLKTIPSVSASTVFEIRYKADAKGGKETEAGSTYAASDSAYLALFYGTYMSGTRERNGVESARIFLTQEEADAAVAQWDASKTVE